MRLLQIQAIIQRRNAAKSHRMDSIDKVENEFVYGEEDMRHKAKMFSVRSGLDLPFFLLVLTLVVIGLIMLFSASYASAYYETGSRFCLHHRQGIFAVVGVGAMIFISYFDYHWLHKLTFPLWG